MNDGKSIARDVEKRVVKMIRTAKYSSKMLEETATIVLKSDEDVIEKKIEKNLKRIIGKSLRVLYKKGGSENK